MFYDQVRQMNDRLGKVIRRFLVDQSVFQLQTSLKKTKITLTMDLPRCRMKVGRG